MTASNRPEWAPELIATVDDVDLCVQTVGDSDDPALLLIGASMLTWDDEFCERLASGHRFVIRYDLRDTGRSTTIDPEAPQYSLRDLVADAAGLLDAMGVHRAHVVGFATGGWIGQLLALDHAEHVDSLTLISTRPTAPGPNDPDLPEHAPAVMTHLSAATDPDWTDLEAVLDAVVDWARCLAGDGGFDEDEVRDRARRIAERTVATRGPDVDEGASHRANQMAIMFAHLDSGPRWRERLGTITAPTLVVHGSDDPFFPIGNAEALVRDIPRARLLTLPGVGHDLPRRVWDTVVPAILRHTEPT